MIIPNLLRSVSSVSFGGNVMKTVGGAFATAKPVLAKIVSGAAVEGAAAGTATATAAGVAGAAGVAAAAGTLLPIAAAGVGLYLLFKGD